MNVETLKEHLVKNIHVFIYEFPTLVREIQAAVTNRTCGSCLDGLISKIKKVENYKEKLNNISLDILKDLDETVEEKNHVIRVFKVNIADYKEFMEFYAGNIKLLNTLYIQDTKEVMITIVE
jgi:hypothetical protein